MNPSLLLMLLNPSLWAQVLKVANEVTTLINHPSVVGVAQAISDSATAVAEVAPAGAVADVATAVSGAGAAVAGTYSTGKPTNVIESVVAGITNGLNSLATHLSTTSTPVAAVPVPPSETPAPTPSA